MMLINSQNEYPRFLGDLLLEFPNYKEGEPLPNGWKNVELLSPPQPQSGQVVYEGFPNEVDEIYYQNWLVRDLTAEELQEIELQQIRNKVAGYVPLTQDEANKLVG